MTYMLLPFCKRHIRTHCMKRAMVNIFTFFLIYTPNGNIFLAVVVADNDVTQSASITKEKEW